MYAACIECGIYCGTFIGYSLQTDSVSEDRLFCLYYRIGAEGKIDWVKEVECIEFLDTIY